MAAVTLDFVPPVDPDVTHLRIYEATMQDGAMVQIDRVEAGTYPTYITRYTTALAADAANWFAIAWENEAGPVISPLSVAVRGNVDNYVAKLVDRILLRDLTIGEGLAVDEAEAVLENYLGEDPYSTEKLLTNTELLGLTYLALARIYTFKSVQDTVQSEDYTAGIVSQKSSSWVRDPSKAIADLLKMAQSILGLPTSRIAQMAEICVAGGAIVSFDISRLEIVEAE